MLCIVLCLLRGGLAAEAHIHDESALLQTKSAVLMDSDKHSEQDQQKACRSNVAVSDFENLARTSQKARALLTEVKLENVLGTLYYIVTFLANVAQFTVDAMIASKGEVASTSPATVVQDNTACRDNFLAVLNGAGTKTLTDAVLKTSAACIRKDMDKCVATIRTLEWISAGIDNAQELMDNVVNIWEIREAVVEKRVAAEKAKDAADKEAKLSDEMFELDKKDDEFRKELSNSMEEIQSQIHKIHAKGSLSLMETKNGVSG